MRIAVDARCLEPRPTGVGRYLEGLLGAWKKLYPDDFVLVSPRPVHVPPGLVGAVEVAPRRSSLPGTLWLQAKAAGEARREGAEAFFGPLGILPILSSLPGVATIHDLTPLLYPDWHPLRNRLGFVPFIGPTVRVASRLAVVSEATRRDLVGRFPLASAKTVVVPNGVAPPSPPGPEPVPGNPSEPFVLFLGTREPRKNLTRLVEAMESIWDRRGDFPNLVVAGSEGWGLPGFRTRVKSSRHAGRIRLLGWVSGGTATALLRSARLLAYPSLYEGFGLPALEAMALGTPVVASSSSSLPEVVGDAGLLPDPQDALAIASAIERAHDDEAFRSRAARLGPERAALFTWEAAAKATRRLFEESLS